MKLLKLLKNKLFKYQNLEFEIHEKCKTATLTGTKNKHSTFLFIPSYIKMNNIKYKVESIGTNALKDCHLKYVRLPKNLMIIENGAFENNDLKFIQIPKSTISIGKYAFANNKFTNLSNYHMFIDNLAFSQKKSTEEFNNAKPTTITNTD